jgi:hypothetical protein
MLFKSIGLRKTLSFLGTGDINNSDLETFADERLFGPLALPKTQTILDLFTIAEVPRTKFSNHSNRNDLLEKQDLRLEEYQPILDDSDWINLQEICTN